jgi:iron-sulfur cluster assembly protein
MSAAPQTATGGDLAPEGRAETKPGPAFTLSPQAVDAVARQVTKRGTPGASLRVGIRGGGCSGFSYVIEFHDGPPRARDKLYELVAADGTAVRVVVDPKSLIYLNGTVLEWEQTLMHQGFKFANPNEKSGCGCGSSFNV